MNRITIIIAEDHPIFRDGLVARFKDDKEIVVVDEVENGQALIEKATALNPKVILLDIEMPVMSGKESMMRLKKTHPNIKFIVLSMNESEKIILDLVEKGCNAYLSKHVDFPELRTTIKMVMENGYHFTEEINKLIYEKVNHNSADSPTPADFSEKERQIALYICMEDTNEDIAKKMNMSKRTVEGYRLRIFDKTNVKSPIGLLKWAQKHGMMD